MGQARQLVAGRWLAVLALLASVLVTVVLPPSAAFAALPYVEPGVLPIRQATPDLTATKSNNVGGSAAAGRDWIWTIDIANGGAATATFTAGQIVLIDNLPNANVNYGTPVVSPPTGGASGPLTCNIDFTIRLTCVANGGAISLPFGGAFRVAFSANSQIVGVYANPRAGGACAVDPNNNVAEGAEGNNGCTDTVTVRAPDLSVTKTNNVGGAVNVGASWIWTFTIANAGPVAATFDSGEIVLIDNLPNVSVTYGAPTVTAVGGATGPLACSIDFTIRLACAAGGTVTMPPVSSFQVAVTATATAPGAFVNPRTGGVCQVDPNGEVVESNEGNNTCSDLVRAGPDLTAIKTNNVGGVGTVGASWTWTIAIDNTGATAATFAANQIVFADNLPNTGVIYGTPTLTAVGGATGPLTCDVDFTIRLTCVASGGNVTIPAAGGYRIALTATATAPGVFTNPRAGGACGVDPNGVVVESNEANNACGDEVRAGPDLTATATNNVGGSAGIGVPWTWTITVANAGTSVATFAATQAVLFDHLPPTNVTYGTPTVTALGGATGPLVCAVDFTIRLACFATGGAVTLPPGGSFQVVLTATSATPGVYANPRSGQACAADPNSEILESVEANNGCSDTVTVGAQAASPAAVAAPVAAPPAAPVAVAAPPAAHIDGNDDDEDDEHLTETQRHQRAHTNASGQDDYRTEGNVLEVRCDASTEPQYEVSFPTHTPYLVIATRDGNQQLRLLYGTRRECSLVQVGDYVEADGDKEHELLFNAHEITIQRRR